MLTYGVAKELAKIIKPLRGHETHYVDNIWTFIEHTVMV